MSTIANPTSADTEQIIRSVVELRTQSDKLKNMISFFEEKE